MLCETFLNHRDFELKTKEMNEDIVAANYNQQPIDITGRLYGEFAVYESLPEGTHKKSNYTDTADKGTDFLCSVDYIVDDGEVYVTDLLCTDAAMEDTEPQVAAMLDADAVNEAVFESNNGGRGFRRNVERILNESGTNHCVLRDEPQTANKEVRILASSAWVNRHVNMPSGWKHR